MADRKVWKFNRGEWTEAYVFLRLLGVGRIYGATPWLLKDLNVYIDIINIIRDEPDRYLVFKRFVKDGQIYICATDKESEIRIVTAPELDEKASILYDVISKLKKGLIAVPEIQQYLENLHFAQPKARLSKSAESKYGDNADIIITSENSSDHARSEEGFSIKSHLGSPATLFNGSSTSGFRYRIKGCDRESMHRINRLDSFVSIIQEIKTNFSLEYVGCRNEVFKENLELVDCCMPEILNEAMMAHIGYSCSPSSKRLKDICESVTKLNPMDKRHPEWFYETKFKEFLFASFAGMKASKLWDGKKRITGGYIDVDKDGEMLYFRAMSDDSFCSYLYEYTYFDLLDRGYLKDLAVAEAVAYYNGRNLTEDERNQIIYTLKDGKLVRNPKKGAYGFVYEMDSEYFIDICFQVRFK